MKNVYSLIQGPAPLGVGINLVIGSPEAGCNNEQVDFTLIMTFDVAPNACSAPNLTRLKGTKIALEC